MKQYLGDGVYVDVEEGLGLVLTTENGITVTNRIVLEPEVFHELTEYVNKLQPPPDTGFNVEED